MKSGAKTIRDSNITIAKYALAKSFKDSPSYYQVLMSTTSIDLDDSIFIDAHIVDNSEVRDEKKITTYFDSELSVGNIIHWQSKYWITIHQDNMSEIYKRGIIRRCYETLKWQDSQGQIREAWFAMRADVSPNFGIDDKNKIITMPDERRQIIIQSNQYTQEFRKDRRFIFDHRAWKIITLNDIAEGIIDIVLEESKINPATDNEELRIANYIDIKNKYSLSILNGDNICIDINQTLQLNVQATNNGSIADLNEIVLSSSNEYIAKIDSSGLITPISFGQITITAEYKGIKATMDIEIREKTYNNYTVDIIGDEVIHLNKVKEYRCVFKNNGYVIDEQPVYTLLSEDGVSKTNLASIISQSNGICSIKTNNNNQFGYIKLYVKSLNGLIEGSKMIRIKSLL